MGEKMSVKDKLKEKRIERGYTQKKLSELCGIAESTIRQYELGKRNPKLETIEKIATALEFPVHVFVENVQPDDSKQRLLAYYEKLSEAKRKELLEKAEELINQK